jgi:hypothetical protein
MTRSGAAANRLFGHRRADLFLFLVGPVGTGYRTAIQNLSRINANLAERRAAFRLCEGLRCFDCAELKLKIVPHT